MEDFKDILEYIKDSYKEDKNRMLHTFPSQEEIEKLCNCIINLVTLGRCDNVDSNYYTIDCAVDSLVKNIYNILNSQLYIAYRKNGKVDDKVIKDDVKSFLKQLVKIKEDILKDALWALENDPASKNVDEVVLSYPCIVALSIYRAASFLFKRNIPYIPRMMSEIAHSKTGIDIHPGASIASPFFIDHGTGTVIGQTCVIGSYCKVYQGVTLGAIRITKDGKKRHPTLEDNVTIYANSSILGDVVIGKNSIIGSNVRLRENISPNSLVTSANFKHEVRQL